MKPINKIKRNGEVFTPNDIVNNILNIIGYDNNKILDKHIIDNSAGDGAFLKEIVARYIGISKKNNVDDFTIKIGLQKYIHGIELDKRNYSDLIFNLNNIASTNKINDVKWDIENSDALKTTKFFDRMDYVVGNPPYVRVHNLDNHDLVKTFSFAKTGMTDLYIVFFELGLKMLNMHGKMSYITPTSWWTSLAGDPLRKYIQLNRNLSRIINLGHYQPFKGITAYTCITLIEKNNIFNCIKYAEYSNSSKHTIINYDDIFIEGKMYFSRINGTLKKILTFNSKKYAVVKNGYATLNDDVFIKDNFPPQIQPLIRIIKGSTGKFKYCLYPYNKEGKLIDFNTFNNDTQRYLKMNLKMNGTDWYGFGRTQALNDTNKEKIVINSLVNSKPESLKISQLHSGIGVYSGLYILTDRTFEQIKRALINPFFIQFVHSLRKYKNGGCFTFNTSDVQKYLNYYFEHRV